MSETQTPGMRLAVFASGAGTNLQRLLDLSGGAALGGAFVALVVSDRPGCLALDRAAAAGVPTCALDPRAYPEKAAYERAVLAALQAARVEWIVLAGYMRIVGPVLLGAYPERIINLHPSLLPEFRGKDAIGQALAAGVRQTGVTVHLVDAGLDTGPIIAQEVVPIAPEDDAATLHARVQRVEHRLLPAVVRALVLGQRLPQSGVPTSASATREEAI